MYLLQTKDKVFDCFKIYKAEVEKQRGKEIKILRSDIGGEYISNEMASYFQEHGFIYEFSPSHTPQFNRVAGKKKSFSNKYGKLYACYFICS